MLTLAPRLEPVADQELWVTFDSEQSRSLLVGRNVRFIRDTPPRDWRAVLHNLGAARKLLRQYDIGSVVSTGAGVALSFLPLAQARGIPAHYIESSARMHGPSLTGRALEPVSGVKLYTQHGSQARGRWQYRGSTFDGLERRLVARPRPLRRLVVTVGTLPFPFGRLLTRLRAILPQDVEVLIQAGATTETVEWPAASWRVMMPPDDLRQAMSDADAVVAHAGIGSLLMACDAGKVPILVPRTLRYREHVDDHQTDIARAFSAEGLAVMADAATISLQDFTEAAKWTLVRSPMPIPFKLQ